MALLMNFNERLGSSHVVIGSIVVPFGITL